MNFVVAALVVSYLILTGYGFVKIFFRDKLPLSLLGAIPLAFVSGLGLLGCLASLIIFLKWRISGWSLSLPLLPLFIYGLTKVKIESINLSKPKRLKIIEWIFILLIIFGAGSSFLLSVDFPLHFWDSRAIWGLKAKMLYQDGTVYSPNFMDEDRMQPHFRYPLLYPIAQAFIYYVLGGIDDWAVMVLIGLFFPLIVSFLVDLIRAVTGKRENALMGGAILSLLPVYYMPVYDMMDGAHSGYADTPLALFYLVSFGMLFLWKKNNDNRLFLLGAVLSSLLPLVKNEGTVLWLLNLILAGWPVRFNFDMREWLKAVKNIAVFIVIAAVLIAPWLIIRSHIPDIADEQYPQRLTMPAIVGNLYKAPIIVGYYLKAFGGVRPFMMWGELWIIAACATVYGLISRKRIELTIPGLIFLFYLFMAGIWLIGPAKNIEELIGFMDITFCRVSLSVTSLLVLYVCMLSDHLNLPLINLRQLKNVRL
jgi:hypothetical protein